MNHSQGELLAAVNRVVWEFELLGIDYLIGGSVASSIYGEPRHTVDADLVASVLGKHAKPLVDSLADEFYVNLDAIFDAVKNQGSFNLIHLETMSKVDVFVSWRTPFGRSQFLRKQKLAVGDQTPSLFFASPEDIILAKLEWFRKGGCVSDRQWRDILGILKVQAERLDSDYLVLWAKELEVGDLLNKAFQDLK
ncbi:MAG: hypothetical protein JWM99_2506 [Verrucomicrobiales bacterium]|nr:hypothetical protein [Verrucomicrobiales bacterium]